VANLAETAAYDIGANPNVARVGGYYHDIGKLKYPQYFSENQIGENPHDELDPYSSVAVLNSHISVGLTMADEYRLPKAIKDIVAQHHGSSLIKFFYHKASMENPEDKPNETDFHYKQVKPQTKEAAVVMLADTVEAAVRSKFKESKSMQEIDEFIRELIKDKLDDGQLIDSGFTIKDIDTVAKSFMRVFKGMYHERIPYPKMEK
jgi:putative nucleotidyltransferase with HDIG domain